MTDYERGYTDGRNSVQPTWINISDRTPEEDGNYYTITELQHDTPAAPKGTISIDVTETWRDGRWWQDDDSWRVLYWAEPIELDVPVAIADRPRLGSL